jgi:ribosomal protein L37AE/L43A
MSLQYIPGFLFLAGIAGFFLFLRLLEYQVRRDRQKSLAQLAAWPCPRCEVPFGAQAADAARKEGERQMAEAMKDAMERGIQLRVVMRWPMTCRQCGDTFVFRPDTGVLSSSYNQNL